MTAGTTTFLGSAGERLLPQNIPFRFFAAAVLFHVAAWIVLALHGEQIADFSGGSGPVLAALHLITLGVFTMTAMGASLQLLPVATLQGFAAPGTINGLWWLLSFGTVCLCLGMYLSWYEAMALGGCAVAIAILVYLYLLVGNLRRGRAMAVVVAHGWLAALSLLALLLLGLALVFNQQQGWLMDSQRVAVNHMLLALYGFMGLFAMGFSYVLVPMFALAPAAPDKVAFLALLCAGLGLILGIAGVGSGHDVLAAAGGALGLIGAAVHIALMVSTLRQRLRKRLGPGFALIGLSWALFPLSLIMAIAWALDLSDVWPSWWPAVFVLSLVGWLLSLLLAMLQRIVPFLAAMHGAASLKRPPTVTALTAQGPLSVHLFCHCAAIALLAAGIIMALPMLIKAGAILGLGGALAFAWFYALAMLRFRRALASATL